MRFLGVTFSHDFKWNVHVENVVKKACKRLFVLRNLRRSKCSSKLLFQSYTAFIRSVLIYSYPAICNAPDYLTQKLFRIERRAFRIMSLDPKLYPSLLEATSKLCYSLFHAKVLVSASEWRHEAAGRVPHDDVLTDLVNGARAQTHSRLRQSWCLISPSLRSAIAQLIHSVSVLHNTASQTLSGKNGLCVEFAARAQNVQQDEANTTLCDNQTRSLCCTRLQLIVSHSLRAVLKQCFLF